MVPVFIFVHIFHKIVFFYKKSRLNFNRPYLFPFREELIPVLRRHGEFLATVCTTGGKYATAIGSAHALAESVLVDALAV